MAKKKQATTSSSHRHQRGPRQDRKQNQIPRRNHRKQPVVHRRNPWLLVGGILVLVAAIVSLFLWLGHQPDTQASKQDDGPIDATTLKQVTNVDPKLLSQTGTGGLPNPFKVVPGTPPLLTGPSGKPEVFFYGAEWCPLCAAERWGIVIAMSRFGTFHNLKATTSASDDSYPNTATLSFFQSSYTSSYLDFVPVESQDSQHTTQQTPAAQEQQRLTRYQVAGFPFMDIADRYLITSATYNPGVLRTNPQDPSSQPLSRQEIASQLSAGNALSQNVLGTANYLTSALCLVTKNQPAQVCHDPSIEQIESLLTQAGQTSTSWDSRFWQTTIETSALERRRTRAL